MDQPLYGSLPWCVLSRWHLANPPISFIIPLTVTVDDKAAIQYLTYNMLSHVVLLWERFVVALKVQLGFI